MHVQTVAYPNKVSVQKQTQNVLHPFAESTGYYACKFNETTRIHWILTS